MAERRHHATSEHVFSSEETDFLIAMDSYKRRTGKQFPTLSETLHVLRSLGYERKKPEPVSMEVALALFA
jgi:hypothetical protein